ncbi:flagellin [Agrobacterium sp. OT33]|uniref:flagellin N-terminal helical domain-containing protein n=1 Tax=Agrobacterium sp. OT33 TaxID=2815338 RepID=UPI000A4FE83C|nr:flagellin [Agrobacterium sp. OT33]MBO0124342.1 flagellar protein FlaD [Agrobacterium sp. OT33]
MTSIMTNAAAMAALQTLRMIDKSLETTQARVSSGYRVETAADNAAYWSISTTMRSDNTALSAVQDALGLGAAKVDTAFEAIESAIETVESLKAKLVAAYGVGSNRSKIQEEIKQLQDQLKSISESASFSGENWLQAKIGDGKTPAAEEPTIKKIVASFTRTAAGAVGVTTVDYSLDSSTVLFDLSGGKFGILDTEARFLRKNETIVTMRTTDTPALPAVPTVTDKDYVVTTLKDSEVAALSGFTVKATGIYTNAANTEGYLKISDGVWVKLTSTDPADAAAPTTDSTTPVVTTTSPNTNWYYDVSSAIDPDDRKLGISVSTLDINKLTDLAQKMGTMTGEQYTEADVLDAMMSFVDGQLEAMTSAASSLGSLQSRIDMQENFVSSLMDVIDKGIGRLVDADMNEESTRLKALQTQQQLGIQSLSIANANAENILQLFK